MQPFTVLSRATRFLPLFLSFVVVLAGLAVVLLSGFLFAGLGGPCALPSTVRERETPSTVDPSRFSLVAVSMPESNVLDLLGLPTESKGPQLDAIRVPEVLNPQDCTGQVPCQCDGPVKELFYYRGGLGESFYVYVDRAGLVCCYQRIHVMRMDFTSY